MSDCVIRIFDMRISSDEQFEGMNICSKVVNAKEECRKKSM